MSMWHYQTDIWETIEKNNRPHPFIMAWLYHYCPVAAYHYLVGIVPQKPFDPVWLAMSDYVNGGKMVDYLKKYGFDPLLEDVKRYIQAVSAYRQETMIENAEMYPTFRGGAIPPERRYGVGNAIDAFGGNVRNLFLYARTWTFLITGWRDAMRLPGNAELKLVDVEIKISTKIPAVKYPFWVWRTQEETIPCVLGSYDYEDWIRSGLLKLASVAMGASRAYILDPFSTRILRVGGLDTGDYRLVVEQLQQMAYSGPYSPSNIFSRRFLCEKCAFYRYCFIGDSLSPSIINFSELKGKFRFSG